MLKNNAIAIRYGLSSDLEKKFRILAALSVLNRPTLADLTEATGVPGVTIGRHITQIKRCFIIDIEFYRTSASNKRGVTGYYRIVNWGGLLNEQEFLLRFKDINTET